MRKYIKNISFFVIPFGIYFVLVYLIDPFNYYNKKNYTERKINLIAKKTEPHLYKLIDFKNNPKENIVLGDSRSDGLFSVFEKIKLENWSNLAYGGGSLNEVIETFWHITKTHELDSVLININFNHFNGNNSRNWIKPTTRLIDNPILYSYSKYVNYSILESINSPAAKESKKDLELKNEFWESHLKMINNKFYKNIIYPKNYVNELNDISKYCNENNIKLIFWVAPVHKDIHDIIRSNGYTEDYNKFIKEIKNISDLFNFDNDTLFRKNKSNFNDAMHLTKNNLHDIYENIFKKL